MQSNKIFSTDIEVRFRDLDALGHVNNAVFFTYFEEGRKNFSKKIFKVSDLSDFSFIMAHIRCDYLKPIKFNGHITLKMWVKHIGNRSFSFEYKLIDSKDESMVYATGESVQVCYDYTADTSMAVTDKMREAMAQYLIQP
ncbi:MAG TPA: acyl-CoA thioesterase [Desulfobacterales bacterium]|nr:acyl-CoA thioesterase [Desulfobacterales bacterium]